MNGNNKKTGGLTGIFLCIAAIILLKAAKSVIGKLLSVILTLGVVAVLIFCGIVVFTALKDSGNDPSKSGPKKPSQDEAKLLSKGRSALAKIKTSNLKVKNAEIKEKCASLSGLADRILSALQKEPEKTGGCVDLLEYYLPELANIIARYTAIQDQPGADSVTEKLSSQLDSVSDTMMKTLSAVAAGEQLDMSNDMEALKIALSLEDSVLPKDEAEELAEKYGE